MCDTLCSLPRANPAGLCYFAKNSDRSPNEPHLVLHVPAARYSASETLRCTYIDIPQVDYTREMLLYKPSWIWGAEMGVNASRVAIGNEAVFTKAKKGPPALTGMDLLRLALERADSASAAVEVILSLLEAHGQGGNCGYDHNFFYDNSFLAADPKEAFVLETSGKNYALTRVEDRYAISNRLCIGTEHTRRQGLAAGQDFAKHFTEPVFSHFSGAKLRREQTMAGLSGKLDVPALFALMRGHAAPIEGKEFTQGTVKSVCMHGGGLVGDHTTGSLVAVLRPEKPMTLWTTGASTPCIAAYKPVFCGMGADAMGTAIVPPVFRDPDQSETYWREREQLHRSVLAGLADAAALRGRFRALEGKWLAQEQALMAADTPDPEALASLSRLANEQEQAVISEFSRENWRDITRGGRFSGYWKKKNAAL